MDSFPVSIKKIKNRLEIPTSEIYENMG